MFRIALAGLFFSAVAYAETPDPKPLERRVESLEARVAKLERLLAIQPATVPALQPIATYEQPVAIELQSAPQQCVGGNCGSASGGLGTRSGPIRRLFGR